eukprot:g15159.t1
MYIQCGQEAINPTAAQAQVANVYLRALTASPGAPSWGLLLRSARHGSFVVSALRFPPLHAALEACYAPRPSDVHRPIS